MFRPGITKLQMHRILDEMSELDFSRFLYCQEMAGAYLAVAKFEDMLISAMQMCDRIKLKKALGSDVDHWSQSLAKKALLQGSTLGSLIQILRRHDVAAADIAYLEWIKEKRDYFIHRFFHEPAWPGELDEPSCRYMARRLMALQLWLQRAERNMWLIFERAGFVELDRFEDGGLLVTNTGIYDLFKSHDTED